MVFRLDCGFLVSNVIPSEAAYSRMITIISESNVLEKAWKMIFKRRTAVERINAYLTEYFQLDNNVRYRTEKRAKVYFDLVTLELQNWPPILSMHH